MTWLCSARRDSSGGWSPSISRRTRRPRYASRWLADRDGAWRRCALRWTQPPPGRCSSSMPPTTWPCATWRRQPGWWRRPSVRTHARACRWSPRAPALEPTISTSLERCCSYATVLTGIMRRRWRAVRGSSTRAASTRCRPTSASCLQHRPRSAPVRQGCTGRRWCCDLRRVVSAGAPSTRCGCSSTKSGRTRRDDGSSTTLTP